MYIISYIVVVKQQFHIMVFSKGRRPPRPEKPRGGGNCHEG
jgi:hypothetical protein